MSSYYQLTGNMPAAPRPMARQFLLVLTIAVTLTAIFFPRLWQGGGLVGGDIYAYFYPQKQYLAECFRNGEVPLWNNRTGNGYPTVGESQTGVFYPFHVAYRYVELNTAYNAIQMVHYVIAFVGCWLLAQRWGLTMWPACLAATVYTYGWLPSRICVEWAALTAAWLPWAIWFAESFLQTARRRYLGGLALVLAVQLLAGHFHLAFITDLILVVYLPLRLWWSDSALSPETLGCRGSSLTLALVAMACGFGLASVQLGPTWELKQLSQRAALGDEHDPGYGFIPWWYLGQMVAPWSYYVSHLSLGDMPAGSSRTNTVEAHLYCGLLPLALTFAGIFMRRRDRDARTVIWWVLGLGALVYATGALMPVARHLPGFGFFNGVGRYGIAVNLAVGCLAAETLQRLTRRINPRTAAVISLTAVLLTTADCWWVSRLIQHSFATAKPPLKYLEASPFRRELATVDAPVRLFCRGANIPNLLGVSSTPVYLGIGPNAYFDPRISMPHPLPFQGNPTPAQIEWLRRAGVTHLLTFEPLDLTVWPIQQVLVAADPFLNRAWGRSLNEPFSLYSLDQAPGRVYWAQPARGDRAEITAYRANSVTINSQSPQGGILVLSDLDWPGWQVTIDGAPATAISGDPRFTPYRAVAVPAGEHQLVWTFRPASVWWGAVVSLISSVALILLLVVRHLPVHKSCRS